MNQFYLTAIGGLVLRMATQFHTLGDVLIWIGVGALVLIVLLGVAGASAVASKR